MRVSTPIDALRELAAIVGNQHVISDALEPFRHDATFMDGELIAAVLPGTTEEVAAASTAFQSWREAGGPAWSVDRCRWAAASFCRSSA